MKIKKVLFIRSSYYADTGKVVRAERFFDRLTIKNLAEQATPLLAAYTPSQIKVDLVDDCISSINFETDADVIAISAQLIMVDRAIDLARTFKSKGKIVVMGGYLPTLAPETVVDHVDSICMGEGDLIWPQMLKDIESGELKKIYRADYSIPLNQIPTPRYDLIRKGGFLTLSSSYPIQATRGCPFKCDYCSITNFYQQSYRKRPISDVIRDIQAMPKGKTMHFVDDNLMEHPQYARELFKAMKGLKRKWGTQGTINMAKDPELLKLAYEAGCRMVLLGMETLNPNNLEDVSKSWTKPETFKKDIDTIQRAGIGVHALIVFGLPNDTPKVFAETVQFLNDIAVAAAEFFIFTPYPGTPLGEKYKSEGRITDFKLSHYREPFVVFKHQNMSAQEIKSGYWSALDEFYSIKNILSRLFRSHYRHKPFQFLLNIYYWLKIKRRIVPTHFNRGNFMDNMEKRPI